MTDLLTGKRSVTISVIKPLLNHLYTEVFVARDKDTTLAKEMKSRMETDMKSQYQSQDISNFLNICTFLDP